MAISSAVTKFTIHFGNYWIHLQDIQRISAGMIDFTGFPEFPFFSFTRENYHPRNKSVYFSLLLDIFLQDS